MPQSQQLRWLERKTVRVWSRRGRRCYRRNETRRFGIPCCAGAGLPLRHLDEAISQTRAYTFIFFKEIRRRDWSTEARLRRNSFREVETTTWQRHGAFVIGRRAHSVQGPLRRCASSQEWPANRNATRHQPMSQRDPDPDTSWRPERSGSAGRTEQSRSHAKNWIVSCRSWPCYRHPTLVLACFS